MPALFKPIKIRDVFRKHAVIIKTIGEATELTDGS